jgi:hypothetical protein
MAIIINDLHQNIQDIFNSEGFELLSPRYSAIRDGNKVTFPPEYIPKNYKKPGFKIENTEEDNN